MTNQEKKAVWLDCDPGLDDAFAIILAAHHPSFELIGISTVFGNQAIDQTTRNAYKVAYIAGLSNSIPIVRGSREAICRHNTTYAVVHGKSGMGEADVPDHPQYLTLDEQQTENYLWDIYQKITSVGRPVTIIAVGALTNVALLLKLFPQIKYSLSEIIVLGGAIGIGNSTPSAEFNFKNDPEAAHIVFTSPHVPRLVLMPIDLTHTVRVTPDIIKRLQSLNSPFSTILSHFLLFFAGKYKQTYDFDSPPLHDPCAVAYAACKDLFEEKLVHVDIERKSEHCQGRSICDIHDRLGKEKNCFIVTKAKSIKQFWNMMLDAIESANNISPLNKNQ